MSMPGWLSRVITAAVTLTLIAVPLARPAPAGASPPGWSGQVVDGFGDAAKLPGLSGVKLVAPPVGVAVTADGLGYWVVTAAGEVVTGGDAKSFGGPAPATMRAPIVGMAATPDGRGYWLVALDGGVFAFGDAGYFGSTGALRLHRPIVGMARTPDGRGYWLVASDGGVFAFGDARYEGSTGAIALAEPIVGIAPTEDGQGYWLVASDGGVFTFGDATFHGSAVGQDVNAPIVGLVPTTDGGGYWLGAATGGVLVFGDAAYDGPWPNLPPFSPAAAIAGTPGGDGYVILHPDEASITFGDVSGTAVSAGGTAIVNIAAAQLGPDPLGGSGAYCNPYGPCEDWCALYATWVWESAGVNIPRYPFTGWVYRWGAARGLALAPTAVPMPGDVVLYGTGPLNASTSVHMGIVAQVWPDGAIDTIEGDSGPEPAGQYGVTINGPYLPADSTDANGMPVYAFVQP